MSKKVYGALSGVVSLGFGVALSLAACQPAAKAPAAKPAAAPAAFKVGALGDSDYAIQGCTSTFGRKGSNDTLFAEDGVDSGAKGFIKIDDKVVPVTLSAATPSEKGTVRVFTSTDRHLIITENVVTGASHQETDSVEQSGSLAVARDGLTQTFQVEGGTAC